MRSAFTLIQDSVQHFKDHAKLFLSIYLIPTVAVMVLTVPIGKFEDKMFSGDMLHILLVGLIVLAVIVINIIATVGLMQAIADPETTTVSAAYKTGREYFWPYVWVSVLTGLAVLIGFVLLIVPGIIVMVWLTFAYYVLLFEGKQGVETLKKSREYVRGKWWAVFGRIIVFVIVVMLVSIVTAIAFETLFRGSEMLAAAATELVNLFLVPFSLIYLYLMYTDVKKSSAEHTTAESAAGSSEG